ncbi:MAG: heparinase II/III-family protein [Oscillospiraceae bacterium]|jgi:hypothetical protein|nr:heparinase II/III-family protein [Oscillospiraceae bacterium]
MLLETFDSLGRDALIPLRSFRPIPKYGDPEWRQIDAEQRAGIMRRASETAQDGVPQLTASLYMEISRNANRSHYETPYFARRGMLLSYALEICAVGASAGIVDKVIDLIWAICEESTWVIPAHNSRWIRNGSPYEPLVDVRSVEFIDLFAAETASVLSWACYLIRDLLDEETRLIVARVRDELRRRVFAPYLMREDFWWMGYAPGEVVNNWNPWVNGNVAAAALLMEEDEEKRCEIVRKTCRSMDIFLAGYAEDGGCEEGPTYFDHAGGTLFDALEMLGAATGGKFNVYDDVKIKNIADYIRQTNIAGEHFMNFADANARLRPAAKLLKRAAIHTKNEKLMRFTNSLIKSGVCESSDEPEKVYHVYRILQDVFTKNENLEDVSYVHDASHYYEGVQAAIMRSPRLTTAARGGNNGESHSHNDVGNYIIYADGEPSVIDVGVETYTLNTFNEKRYTIWTMQSGYHNTAIINGFDQKDGAAYKAECVSFKDDETGCAFSLDISKAYPKEAAVASYKRTVQILRDEERIRVHDEVELEDCAEPLVLPIMCAARPTLEQGKITIGGLVLRYPSAAFCVSAEEIPIPDARLQKGWGRPALYRVLLTAKDCEKLYNVNLVYGLA